MKASLKARDFDNDFDDGKDVLKHLDLSKARRVKYEQRRVNIDFPTWMIESLDKEASRVGVTRQSIIKLWLAERLHRAGPDTSAQSDHPSAGC